MKPEISRLFELLSKPENTEQEKAEADRLLADSSINQDFSKAFVMILASGIEKGFLDATDVMNMLKDMKRTPPTA
jgi:hypothetical protein